MSKQYTGHKDTKINGKTLTQWITPTVKEECNFYGVEMPSERQMAVVISALRMHTIMMHAADYDTSELHEPDKVTEFWPMQSSIGRYFRDAGRATLDATGDDGADK